ncbi:MAG TPA: nuclear transport factor 2 family protein, partial [Mycobacterium sp.]|nr:nuclear transport factor 2 family protein [Mycobacterium sp.]
IRPGTDALLLLALVHVLFDEDRTDVGRLGAQVNGLTTIQQLAGDFSPESVAAHCGIPAADIRRLARELASAPTAAVYGRTGTCTARFGTVSSWLIEVLNTLTGNLDRPGGAMFARPAADLRLVTAQRDAALGRWHSRVRHAPETLGELPLGCLAEEIDTPGNGQVKALITVAGNPARSAPDSSRLTAAFDQLELMVSIDLYRNETTRHAHVVLPAPSPLTKPHYDLFFGHFAIRTATYSPPVLPLAPHEKPEWHTILRLIGIIARQGPTADLDVIDDMVAASIATALDANPKATPAPTTASDTLRGPERLLDLLLRAGPYSRADTPLTLAQMREHADGVDFGALSPQLPGILITASGQIELAPAPLVNDVARLRESLLTAPTDDMVLIGRRHLRSNNSWMHNLPTLAKGPERCTLQVHPSDVERLQLGHYARVTSDTGSVEVPVEVTDAVRPGVVSLPHGWGHDEPGLRAAVAARRPGVNSNVLAAGTELDPLSGTAVLNGILVQVTASPRPALVTTNGESMAADTALREALHHYADAKNRHDVDALVAAYAADGRYEGSGIREPVTGHAQLRKFYAALFHSLPDYHGHFDGTAIGDNTAVAWGRMGGTVGEDLFGLPATPGNRIDVPVTFVCTFRDGLLTSDCGYLDTRILQEQAGVGDAGTGPATPAAAAAAEYFIDGWARFWAALTDTDKVRDLITTDVALHWPGVTEPLRGADAYAGQLAAAVKRIPD